MWSWSYSNEGIDLIMKGIENEPLHDLEVAYAEFEAYRLKDRPNVKHEFNSAAYRRALKQARLIAETGEDILVSAIQSRAQEFSGSDNGGWNAYYCPYGCHTINLNDAEKIPDESE